MKAAYIHNCLKNGETPVAGPLVEDADEEPSENEISVPVPQIPEPYAPPPSQPTPQYPPQVQPQYPPQVPQQPQGYTNVAPPVAM